MSLFPYSVYNIPMPYVSLYRKYRPQTFTDVVGQDHVVRTLQNSLRLRHIANGYLFCGTRGVAKTTIARLFAKALNCIGPNGSRNQPAEEPCNECAACKSITAGQCVDVIEMDAASNRSVNDMAKIRENVAFGPMENRYKIYIVDEAHQLTADAKDAFLKTLEEPPANVVFILATTESHAIPITIASRCQAFDFKRGSLDTISRQIEKILSLEKVSMDAAAVSIVARSAEGSYRDALSILEQVIAYKSSDVSAADVREVLGWASQEALVGVLDAAASSDGAKAFAIADRLFSDGKDVGSFFKSLATRLRDMLYVSVGAGSADLSGDDDLKRQAKLFPAPRILGMIDTLAQAQRDMRTVSQQRLLLEMTLLKLTLPAESALQPVTQGAPAQAAPVHRPVEQRPRPAAPVHVPTPSAPAPTQAPPMVRDDRSYAPAPQEQAHVPVAASISGQDQADYLRAHWREFLNHMQVRSRGGYRVLQEATVLRQEGATIVLGLESNGSLALLERPNALNLVVDLINTLVPVSGATLKVKGELISLETAQAPLNRAGNSADNVSGRDNKPTQPSASDSPDLVQQVISIFGGQIVDEL